MPDPDKHIVAFYNLENLFDTVDDPAKEDDDFLPGSYKDWSEYRYLEKLENITRSIVSINQDKLPAIIGVSEIENKTVLTDLVYQSAFKREFDFIHYDSQDKRGIDVALIYNRNILTVLSHENIQVLSETDDQYTTRDILYVKGDFSGGDAVHFFVNHWPSRREGTRKSMPRRIAAAQSLYQKLSPLLQSDPLAKVVIMGDFNDLPVSRSIARYLNARSHKNIKKDELYNLAFIPYSKKMGTVFAKGRWLMFDQILISQGMMTGDGIKIKSSRLTVHFDKRLLFYDKKRSMYRPNRSYSGKKYHGGFSDHLPVYVNLDMP
jgi:endonuclease/exonuclease/phosphatase family metal-dependent hydrolase